MGKIHTWPAIFAATVTIGLLYTICTLLFVFFPARALSFFKSWFHGIDLAKIASGAEITISSFFMGLLWAVVVTAAFTLLFVWVYNSCMNHCERKGWLKKE